VVIGSFTDYDTVLSESRRSIYSEMHIRVERVIKTCSASVGNGEIALPLR
jgi:hypothetical protein